jgi:D-alanyl-D-alanine carboxypeptidase/D-alanyl-D-alanine-endopeptidase (penicillin-binding protein 4)
VRAKTGTLEDAAALSGYVLSPSGKGPVAFSILFNHVAGKVAAARAAADTLVDIIARTQANETR